MPASESCTSMILRSKMPRDAFDRNTLNLSEYFLEISPQYSRSPFSPANQSTESWNTDWHGSTTDAPTRTCFSSPMTARTHCQSNRSAQSNSSNTLQKYVRISTDISWWVFHILTEPVQCTFVSVNRRNNAARGLTLQCEPGLRYAVDLQV